MGFKNLLITKRLIVVRWKSVGGRWHVAQLSGAGERLVFGVPTSWEWGRKNPDIAAAAAAVLSTFYILISSLFQDPNSWT